MHHLNSKSWTCVPVLLALLAAGGALAAGPGSTALPCGCDYSPIPGALWWGDPTEMTVAELAAYAAPVFWFSPDEPSLNDLHGTLVTIPEPFPFEESDGPVVYYQLNEIVRGDEAPGPNYRPAGENPGTAIVDMTQGALMLLEYYAYYADEAGFSAHQHDVEGAELRLGVAPSDGPFLAEYGLPSCGNRHMILIATRVTGKAHGIEWYWNVLDVDEGARFPINLMVEEGKHATAPDKNHDGYFTPSYDVNIRINDAWGVRDIIRSGGLFSSGYRGWMTKVRHPEDRVLPPLPEDSPLRYALSRQQAEYLAGNAVYELRPLPTASVAAAWDTLHPHEANLEKFLVGKEMPEGPNERVVATPEEAYDWITAGALKKSLSIAAYSDGRLGFSWVFPMYITRNLTIPMTGGYVLHRMYAKGPQLRDFGWTLLYTGSASRWMDPYLAAGAEWHDLEVDGQTVRRTEFVMDLGLKFRTQVGQSPLGFLSFLTDFWGLRIGMKNYGFFDVDRITYVLEIGAGSF